MGMGKGRRRRKGRGMGKGKEKEKKEEGKGNGKGKGREWEEEKYLSPSRLERGVEKNNRKPMLARFRLEKPHYVGNRLMWIRHKVVTFQPTLRASHLSRRQGVHCQSER